MNLRSRLTIALVVLLFTAATHAENAALRRALEGHFWSWQSAQTDTLVIFEKDGTLVTREKQTSRWQLTDDKTVRVTFPGGQTLDLVFSPDQMRFVQTGGSLAPITGERKAARPAAPQALVAAAANGAVGGVPSTLSSAGGIALHKDWMPQNIHTRKVLLESIEFYCRMLVADEKAEPVIPDKIWGPITWRMPLAEALKTLPPGARRQREFRVMNLAFPQNSLNVTMMAVEGRIAILDECNKFKYISFIADMENRVIGIQLVDPSPQIYNWAAPGPDGVREPYYNFIEDRYNGSTGNCVPYQVQAAGKGVNLIRTILFNQPDIGIQPYPAGQCPGTVTLHHYTQRPYRENVHWYLTAPLAQKLLEIVASIRKQGLDDR